MLQNYNGFRVLELFLDKPTYMYSWTEISKKLSLGPVSVRQYLQRFLQEKLIITKDFKKIQYYLANRENQEFKEHKIFHTMHHLRRSGLIEHINNELNHPTIIIYGSASKGEDTEKSDIDIAIICLKEKELRLEAFEKKTGKPIQAIIIEKKQMERYKQKNKELLNSIINGVVISGFLEVI